MQDKYITFLVIYMDAETPSVCECWPESRAGGGVESRQKRLGFLSFGFQNRRETSIHGAPQHSARNMAGKSLFFAGQGEGHQVGESIPQMCSL